MGSVVPPELAAWVWAPAGSAGSAVVEDQLPPVERHASRPGPLRQQHRCTLEVAGRTVSVDWRGVPMAASVDGVGLVEAVLQNGTGEGSVVWSYTVSPSEVLGEPVTMERERTPPRKGLTRLRPGEAPWRWRVEGPHGRRWTWRAGGGPVLADRVELRRDGEDEPVVVHDLRPVPGRPGQGDELPCVHWTAAAAPAEVLLSVLWVLQESYAGILPRAQRVLRADVL